MARQRSEVVTKEELKILQKGTIRDPDVDPAPVYTGRMDRGRFLGLQGGFCITPVSTERLFSVI
jgi:hypothetical protein